MISQYGYEIAPNSIIKKFGKSLGKPQKKFFI